MKSTILKMKSMIWIMLLTLSFAPLSAQETKPVILQISTSIYTYVPENNCYYVDFTIQSQGASLLSVKTEEDYVSAYHVQDIPGPDHANIHVGPIADYHDAWVDLTLENEYGKTKQTIELYKKSASFKPELLRIIGEDIPDDKIISAYKDHTFTIENQTGYPITQSHWTLELPLNDQTLTMVEESDDNSFTISPLAAENPYLVNQKKIKGTVAFICPMDDKLVRTTYDLQLKLIPAIFHVSEPVYTYEPDNSVYYADFIVQYGGTDYLRASTREDLVSESTEQSIEKAREANVHVGPFNNSHDAWVDLTLQNLYGTTKHTVELYKKATSLSDLDEGNKISIYYNTQSQQLNLQGDITSIISLDICNINGICVKQISDITNIIDLSNLSQSIYIIKYKCLKEVHTIKIFK